jgi:hypothetical protein
MRSILSVVDFELTWAQQSAFKNSYELHFGGELVATLQFPKMRATHAIAETGDGVWKFERNGFWKSKVVVTRTNAAGELGSYTSKGWRGGGIIQMPDGRTFTTWRGFWHRTLELRTDAGESLVQIQDHSGIRLKATVRINRKALMAPELPWLVPFLLYLQVLARNDAAVAAATG